MAADSIGYPLPVWVNGYACLTTGDIDMAKDHLDPAPPPSKPDRGDQGRYDAAGIATARQAAAARQVQVVGYAPDAVLTAAVPTGAVLSLKA